MATTHRVALADITPGVRTHETARLLSAHRRWLGLPGSGPAPSAEIADDWTYQPVATRAIEIRHPLALQPHGLWDPAEQYWGEEGTEIDPLYESLIAAGPRPQFEMEQVIPGVEADDRDLDPVADAAELHRFGHYCEASRILRGLISENERCINAWIHLGNMAFDAKGPRGRPRALRHGRFRSPSGPSQRDSPA